MHTSIRLLALALLLAAGLAQAAVYKVTGPDGKTTYTDAPPASAAGKGSITEVPITSYTGPVQQGVLAQQPDWAAILKRPVDVPARAVKVVMFSAVWCGYCKQARTYMQAKKVAFTDLDVETNDNAKQEYAKLGGRGVPYFVIGRRTLAGFSPEAFDAALLDAAK